MKIFENPVMEINMFSGENIVITDSTGGGSGDSVDVKGDELVSSDVKTYNITWDSLTF